MPTDLDSDRDVTVPADATTHVCDRCGRPFAHEEYLTLHRGLDHEADLSADEWAAYEAAVDEEEEDLFRYRIVALGTLVLLYFGFLYAYAIFA